MQERSLEKRENKSNYKNISRILKRNSNTNSKYKKTQTNTKKKQHPNPQNNPPPSNKIDGKYREPSNRKKTPKSNTNKKARLSL